MAENLNYADSINYPGMKGRNWCYGNSLDRCAKYGRLYTWSAAMDSAGTFSTNGKVCGYNSYASPTYPVRGICPSGWHLPTKAEFETLFTTVGGKTTAGKMLKATNGWNSDGNGTDAFGFSALPAGDRVYNGNFDYGGYRALFWSSSKATLGYAHSMYLTYGGDGAYLDVSDMRNGFSVRCIKD